MAEQNTSPLTLNGIELKVRRQGSGETILLLHGAGGSAGLVPLVEELSGDYEILMPDHPGFGLSGDSKQTTTISDLAYHYLDFIKDQDLNDVHLVGHSMGGWIAAEIAIRSQAALKSLTLICSAGIHVKGVPKGDLFLWSPEESARNIFVKQEAVDRILNYEPSDAELEVMIRNKVSAAKYAWHPRFYNPDLSKWLHRISVPTLVVWGDQDKIFPKDYATAFKKFLPHAEVEVLKDCGHVPHVDRPDRFYPCLRSFLEGAAS